jgi:uncharacterized protein CbrC (UPF0167 family)
MDLPFFRYHPDPLATGAIGAMSLEDKLPTIW